MSRHEVKFSQYFQEYFQNKFGHRADAQSKKTVGDTPRGNGGTGYHNPAKIMQARRGGSRGSLSLIPEQRAQEAVQTQSLLVNSRDTGGRFSQKGFSKN